MEELKSILKQLQAVELLEYHNKNWLEPNKEYRNRMKRNHLEQALYIIEKEEEESMDDLPF